jgi:hypothetical protein
MRTSLFFFAPFFLLANACGLHAYARGAASYTSSPSGTDRVGALPLKPLVCIDSRDRVSVRLDDGCTLVGDYEAHRGRGVTPGGTGRLASNDECALPLAGGTVPLRVKTAMLQLNDDAVDLTLGGKTDDGRYVTYRFTGVMGDDEEKDQCDALAKASAKNDAH